MAAGNPPLTCPACGAELDSPPRGAAPACPVCPARFKSPMTAALMSAALPGAGHFYLRRRALGMVELAGGLILFFCALASLANAFRTVLDEGSPPTGILLACVPWVLILSAYCILDGLFTWMVSRNHLVLLSPPPSPR